MSHVLIFFDIWFAKIPWPNIDFVIAAPRLSVWFLMSDLLAVAASVALAWLRSWMTSWGVVMVTQSQQHRGMQVCLTNHQVRGMRSSVSFNLPLHLMLLSDSEWVQPQPNRADNAALHHPSFQPLSIVSLLVLRHFAHLFRCCSGTICALYSLWSDLIPPCKVKAGNILYSIWQLVFVIIHRQWVLSWAVFAGLVSLFCTSGHLLAAIINQ